MHTVQYMEYRHICRPLAKAFFIAFTDEGRPLRLGPPGSQYKKV